MSLQATARKHRGRPARWIVGAVLLAWGLGLAMATVRLNAWQRELMQVLMQLRADDLLRSSVGQRDQVRPEWYRHRAGALLVAVERLRDNASWTLVMPGSWHYFDDLEDRVARKVDRAFSEVVVETIEHELQARASALTGVPLEQEGTELVGDTDTRCRPAAGADALPTGLHLTDQPAYRAVSAQVRELAGLDRAMATLLALRASRPVEPEALRDLVHYSLGAQLSGDASRSLVLFRSSQAETLALSMLRRMQSASRCSVTAGIALLHRQWLADNEVLRNEDKLAALRPAVLLQRVSATHGTTVQSSDQRLREAAQVLARQQALVGSLSTNVARDVFTSDDLGDAHRDLLAQVARNGLLGQELAGQLQRDASQAQAAGRQRLLAHLERPGAGLAWDRASHVLVATREREAWSQAVSALVAQPFMAPDPLQAPLRTASWSPPPNFEPLVALAEQRRRFQREVLPLFPASQRTLAQRFVDERLLQQALDLVASQLAAPEGVPLDAALQAAVAGASAAEGTLSQAGLSTMASRLRSRLERELLGPLSAALAQSGYHAPAPMQVWMGGPAGFSGPVPE